MNTKAIAQKVGMVFSDPDAQFTTMSVEEEIAFSLENIGVPVPEISKRIKWVCELTHLEELLDKPPYDLSGGQKQRVAIAAVLAAKPKIVILDEPTSMLDPKSKDEVFEILRMIKEELKMTVIVVEHNIEKIAELSDEVLLMNNGKIIRHEKTDEFFKDINLLKENGLKVPESIEILYHLYDKYGIKKTAPVKLDEIMAEIKFLLQKHERN
jgi:energy-coupling factor transport system ATP-binding protein